MSHGVPCSEHLLHLADVLLVARLHVKLCHHCHFLALDPLGRKLLGNLRVYKGAEHPHAAQNPVVVDIAAMNSKNARSA